MYPDNVKDLNEADKVDSKKIVGDCMRPLDTFFSKFGNSIIALCDGMVNAGAEAAVIKELRNDLEETVTAIKASGSAELNDKLTVQLNRLAELGDQLNASEGIVFKFGDKLMKATGSFAALNQALNLKYQI